MLYPGDSFPSPSMRCLMQVQKFEGKWGNRGYLGSPHKHSLAFSCRLFFRSTLTVITPERSFPRGTSTRSMKLGQASVQLERPMLQQTRSIS